MIFGPTTKNRVLSCPLTVNLACDDGQSVTFARASVARFEDDDGVVQDVAIDTPRISPTRGLLIERRTTNLALWSDDISGATWMAIGVVVDPPDVTGAAAAAPDGTVTATQVDIPAVANGGEASVVGQSIVASAVPFSFSIYVKGVLGVSDTGRVYLSATPDGVTFFQLACDYTSAEWTRFTLENFTPTAAAWDFQIGVDLRDGSQVAQLAQSIYVWGAQVEATPYATSPIKTEEATEIREWEIATIPTTTWPLIGRFGVTATFIGPADSAVGQSLLDTRDVVNGPGWNVLRHTNDRLRLGLAGGAAYDANDSSIMATVKNQLYLFEVLLSPEYLNSSRNGVAIFVEAATQAQWPPNIHTVARIGIQMSEDGLAADAWLKDLWVGY